MGSKTDSITESLSPAWRHESLPQKSPKQLFHRLVTTREGGGSLVQCRPLVINVDHMAIQIITQNKTRCLCLLMGRNGSKPLIPPLKLSSSTCLPLDVRLLNITEGLGQHSEAFRGAGPAVCPGDHDWGHT